MDNAKKLSAEVIEEIWHRFGRHDSENATSACLCLLQHAADRPEYLDRVKAHVKHSMSEFDQICLLESACHYLDAGLYVSLLLWADSISLDSLAVGFACSIGTSGYRADEIMPLLPILIQRLHGPSVKGDDNSWIITALARFAHLLDDQDVDAVVDLFNEDVRYRCGAICEFLQKLGPRARKYVCRLIEQLPREKWNKPDWDLIETIKSIGLHSRQDLDKLRAFYHSLGDDPQLIIETWDILEQYEGKDLPSSV